MASERHYSPIDRLLLQADAAMRTLLPFSGQAYRPSPAIVQPEAQLDPETTRHVAGLMRINHTGEVCAQALYQGQALTAKLPEVRSAMEHAADMSEESASLEPEAALKLIKHDPQPNLYVLCDLHPFLVDNPKLVRLLKEIALAEGAHKPTLVLVSHALKLPVEVQRYAARFALALPSEDELLAIVRDEATRWSEANRGARVRTDNRTLQQVVKNLRGMSHAEARALARRVICDDGAITQDDLPELNKSKFQLLDLEGVLSFEYDTARFAEVGGPAHLQALAG